MELVELKQHLLVGYTALKKHDQLVERADTSLHRIHEKMVAAEKKQVLKVSFLGATAVCLGGLALLALLGSELSLFFDFLIELLTFESFFLSTIFFSLYIGVFAKIYETFIGRVTIEKLEKKYWDAPFLQGEVAQYTQKKQKAADFTSTQKFQTDLAFIPHRYRSSQAVSYIYNLLDSQRADSFKEALNIYEDDMHKIRLETLQQQTLTAARNAEIAANEAASAARNAEDNSESASFYAAMTFYNNY